MKPVDRFCELCNAQASLYCASDAAFLCRSCDVKVHQANFLVARHVRRIICSKCKGLAGNPVFEFCLPQSESASFCASCSLASSQSDHLDSISSLSNSDCISSTMSCTTSQKKTDADRRKICSNSSNYLSSAGCGEAISSQRRSRASILDLKAEGVLVYWCRKLGLPSDRAVRLGRNALTLCWDQMTVLPFRVSLAASLWFGLSFCGDRSLSTWQALNRLEEISGVQAKLISAAESKLERVLKVVSTRKRRRPRNHHLEEGWAESECSS